MQVTTLTDLTTEPVSLALAAQYCKVDVPATEGTPEGDLLKVILTSARQWCENYTGLSFGPKTLKVSLPYRDYMSRTALPYGPNIEITSATDAEGNDVLSTMFSSTNFYAEYLKGMSINNTWKEDYGQWPNLYGGDNYLLDSSYELTYTAGYEVGKLPSDMQLAILKTCIELYNNRENTVVGTIIADLPMSAKALLAPYRVNPLVIA